MKKIILSLLFVLFLIPINVYASDGEPTHFYMNVDIDKYGDIHVAELVSLEPTYNGRIREIMYRNSSVKIFNGDLDSFAGSTIYNGSSIENLKVYSISGTDITFDDIFDKSKRSSEFEEVNYASSGDSGVYQKTSLSDGYSLKIFNPSSKNESFLIKYTIKDAVVVHNDVAELAWNLIGHGFEDNIKDFDARVNIPGEDDDIRVWLHGPIGNDLIQREDNKTAHVTYSFIGKNNPVSVRIMFNKELVPYGNKMSNIDGRKMILKYEKQQADKANAIRKWNRFLIDVLKIVSIIWYIAVVILLVLYIIKKKKCDKCDFDIEYLREFPADYGPEVLEYLINKSITTKSFGATILMLIEKKFIKVDTFPEDKKNYKLTFVENKKLELTASEKEVVNLIFNEIGDGKETTTKAIKDYGKKNVSKARQVTKAFEKWKSYATTEAEGMKFFRTSGGIGVALALTCLAGFGISFINLVMETGLVIGIIASLPAIIILIAMLCVKFRTPEGALHYKKWMAVKKFIVDFSNFNEKELPEISLWGKFLVYATVFGCADKLEKDMRIKIKEFGNEDMYMTYYWYNMTDMNFARTINNSMSGAVSVSRSAIAASQSASGGGFGGGSSGGGGSFGGGGGGGHF